jgi:DNA methylase
MRRSKSQVSCPAEIDHVILGDVPEGLEQGPLEPDSAAVARIGDIFQLGPHRIVCGSATDSVVLARLLEGDVPARVVLTDEPYNVKIAGHVTGGDHREFAMASGEMTEAEFLTFNEAWVAAVLPYLCDGGVCGSFIDWRGFPTVHSAATKLGLVPLNLIVWAKSNAGMGSLYRSQHELLPLFKKGTVPHVNNVELGKRGRWRSNVWAYPGASLLGSDARRGLKDHPTVKLTAMFDDALLDLTNRHRPVPRLRFDSHRSGQDRPRLPRSRVRPALRRCDCPPLRGGKRPSRGPRGDRGELP